MEKAPGSGCMSTGGMSEGRMLVKGLKNMGILFPIAPYIKIGSIKTAVGQLFELFPQSKSVGFCRILPIQSRIFALTAVFRLAECIFLFPYLKNNGFGNNGRDKKDLSDTNQVRSFDIAD